MRRVFILALALIASTLAGIQPAGANETSRPGMDSSFLGTIAEATTMEELINSSDYSAEIHGDLLRLYRAFFNREPDVGGAKYWIDINAEHDLDAIAGWMSDGQEFFNNYNGTVNRVYLERVYQNILGREYDQGGFDYWLDFLERDALTRSGVVRWIAANQEFIDRFPYVPTGVAITACDARAEIVTIENRDTTGVILSGWTIQDEGPQFTLPLDAITLAPGESIDLLSGLNPVAGPGQVIITDRNIWNNSGDTAHLFNGTVEISQQACST